MLNVAPSLTVETLTFCADRSKLTRCACLMALPIPRIIERVSIPPRMMLTVAPAREFRWHGGDHDHVPFVPLTSATSPTPNLEERQVVSAVCHVRRGLPAIGLLITAFIFVAPFIEIDAKRFNLPFRLPGHRLKGRRFV
ncbi:MAG: hypothetical protein ACLTMP_09970 [Eggerthella lenta]